MRPLFFALLLAGCIQLAPNAYEYFEDGRGKTDFYRWTVVAREDFPHRCGFLAPSAWNGGGACAIRLQQAVVQPGDTVKVNVKVVEETKDEKTGQFVGGKAIVKAVLSLPADTFKLSGTGAKTSVLYLQKRHTSKDRPEQFLPEQQGDVFMAVAETLGYVVKNNIEDYSAGVPNDLDKIVGAYKRGE